MLLHPGYAATGSRVAPHRRRPCTQISATWDAKLVFDGFEAAAITESTPQHTEIHMWLVERESLNRGEEDGEIKRCAIKRHEEIVLGELLTEALAGQ